MAELHDALKTLGPADFSETPLDDLKPFLSDAFNAAKLIVDSVPIPAPAGDSVSTEGRSRSNTTSSIASSASEVSLSSARSAPPPENVESLQKEWKQVKMNAKDNPLGMSVYKLGGKDGKGAWFARRSVHEGLGFTKWKRGLEKEFPETMKVQGSPGEGNIRGIGGERRVAYKTVEGLGKLEVYLLTAQFPGPTTPRDFVTMLITSDQCLADQSGGEDEVPRHFMVISKPCVHSDTPPRDGFIRGQYESVELIREVPIKKGPKKSASTTNLSTQGNHNRNRSGSMLGREAILRNAKKNHTPPPSEKGQEVQGTASASDSDLPHREGGRARGKTISFDKSRGSDAKGEDMDIPREDYETESNPVEWIMITRSDPGGSVPRFMIERGTPGGIVADASKFLNWACAKDIEDFDSDEETLAGDDQDENAQKHEHKHHHHNHEKDMHSWQTNGHLAGIEESSSNAETKKPVETFAEQSTPNGGGIYGMVTGMAGAAGGYIASHTPAMITNHLPGGVTEHEESSSVVKGSARRESVSTTSSESSGGSFASALERYDTGADASSVRTGGSGAASKAMAQQDKELAKLEEKKRKLEEKLSKAREKEMSKRTEDSAKEEENLRKVEEKHEKEIKKQEEKYKKEVEKLEKKKEKDERKAEEKRRKAVEKDERTKLLRENEELRAEVVVLRREKEILRAQVGELQAENTALAARVGRLGLQGEEVLKEVREDVTRGGRLRASSLKGMARTTSFRSSGSGEKDKENLKEVVFPT